MMPLLTFGHGEASQQRLIDLLAEADVSLVVDVRRFPGSRRHPHVARVEMEQWLPGSGVGYRWEPRLGGRRRLARDDNSDSWWRVEAFRAYAAYTRTEEFEAGIVELLGDLATCPDKHVAIMCSESLWWRCHRRLIADATVLLHHVPVQHLGHDGKISGHVPAAGARVCADGLRYDSA